MIQRGKSDLSRFLKAFLWVLVLIVAADFVAGKVMKTLYGKQKSGLLYLSTYSIDSTRADVLAFGSSRANHHYDPRAFEQVLHQSFYNCGRDDQGALYSCAVISAAIARYTPKAIIIDIRPDEFTHSDEGTLSTLLPYYRNQAVRPYIDYNGQFQRFKLMSGIYPYNSLFTTLIVGLRKGHAEDIRGFVPLHAKNAGDTLKSLREKGHGDSVKINAFYQLIAKLQTRKIPVFLVISPVHAHWDNPVTTSACEEAVRRFANARFINYAIRPQWQKAALFSDDNHLDADGAALFSTEMAGVVRGEITPG